LRITNEVIRQDRGKDFDKWGIAKRSGASVSIRNSSFVIRNFGIDGILKEKRIG
jgi:hypothetical protein